MHRLHVYPVRHIICILYCVFTTQSPVSLCHHLSWLYSLLPGTGFLWMHVQSVYRDERCAPGSGSILGAVLPCSQGEKGMGLGLRPDAFRALTFSHHPHPGVLGLSIQHPPQGVFFKSVLENFLLFLEGIISKASLWNHGTLQWLVGSGKAPLRRGY